MNLDDIFKNDQDDAPFAQYYKSFLQQYRVLREMGMPDELAIGLTIDYHHVQWEHYYAMERMKHVS